MSYDVSLEAPLGQDGAMVAVGALDANYTYNCAPMFYEALAGGIPALHGQRCGDVIAVLREAVADMQDNPAKYRAMNPPNGWGSYDGAVRFLQDILEACIATPGAYIHVS